MSIDMTTCVAAADAVVARHPLALAGLVCDMVWDRRTAPRRPLDPMIGERHADSLTKAIAGDPTLRSAAGRIDATAVVIALLIDRTHTSMVRRGLIDLDSRGDATTARVLFAGAQAARVHAGLIEAETNRMPIAA